jgi:hypothetical protein
MLRSILVTLTISLLIMACSKEGPSSAPSQSQKASESIGQGPPPSQPSPSQGHPARQGAELQPTAPKSAVPEPSTTAPQAKGPTIEKITPIGAGSSGSQPKFLWGVLIHLGNVVWWRQNQRAQAHVYLRAASEVSVSQSTRHTRYPVRMWTGPRWCYAVLGPRLPEGAAQRTSSSPTFARCRGQSAASPAVHRIAVRLGIDERMPGNQRSSSKTPTARRCSLVSAGASITVGRRPAPPVVVRTKVARIWARFSIV